MTRLERLEEIRKRAEKATPGPWEAWRDGNQSIRGGAELVGATKVVGLPRAWNPHGIVPDDRNVSRFRDEDADFIAAAREDIPWLLAEVARLEKDRAETLELCQEISEREDRMRRDIRDMNTPAWGSCVAAAETADEIARHIRGEALKP